jgi:hypothetical protein
MPARVPYLNREDLPEGDRVIFDNLAAERGGSVGNIFRALAHTPNLLRRFCQIGSELRKSPAFNDNERAVIRYAVEATNNIRVTDATWNALKSLLDTQRMMELVQNVAFYNMVVRVLVPVGVELEPGTTKQ